MKKLMLRDERKEMLRLYWPVLIEQALSATIGMVSAMMVSSVGDFAVSGVNMVDLINFTVTSIFIALATGATVIVAHRIGAQKIEGAGETAFQAVLLSVILATILGMAVVIVGQQILRVLYGGADDNVLEAGAVYFLFSGISYPFIGLFTACTGVMRASGNNRTPLVASVLANVINVSLAFMFIQLGMGVFGVSIAMLFARILSGVFSLVMLRRDPRGLMQSTGRWRLKRDVLRPVLGVGIPSGIDALMFNGARVIMTVFMSGMGIAALHAHAITNSLIGLIILPGNALSVVSVTMVGQAYGARLFRKVQRLMRSFLIFCSALQGVMFIVIYLLADLIIGLYSPSAEAAEITRTIVLMFSAVTAVVWSFAFCLPQMLRACGDAKTTMYISVVSLLALRIFGAWFFGIYLGIGVFGVWLGMFLDWFGRAIGYGLRAVSNAWCGGKKPVDHHNEAISKV